MKSVVLASGNAGKLKEFKQLLKPVNINIVPQSELSVPEADETGQTFIENAILKARNAAHHTGLPALADDSGLAIDILSGEPGIYSARYAGPQASDEQNIFKVLEALEDVPDDQRAASFHCVLVYLRSATDPTPIVCHGTWKGKITRQLSGSSGFGYDPIFWLEEQQCCAAELEPSVKNQLSHRAKALEALMRQLTP
jgi:XTP/dITP diphosphohydrolase